MPVIRWISTGAKSRLIWRRFFSQQRAEEIVAEEVTIIPGLEEGAALLWINEYIQAR